jgi:uncharacterized protein YecE (DUF72 family)
VRHYNSIELNATHYKLYKPADLQKWIDKVKNKNFKFSPKVYQGISHFGSFRDKQFLTDTFLQNIVTFGKHLGSIFLQVSDKFGPKRKDELFEYLGSLPKEVQFFLEVRHPDWFTKPTSDELFAKLRKLKIGAVITDIPQEEKIVATCISPFQKHLSVLLETVCIKPIFQELTRG